MLEPPDIPNDRIVASVRLNYGLYLTTLAFLPLGHDVLAWVYRAATADGATYFVKLRQGVANQAGLRVPRYLADHGAPHVVAPIPTRAKRLCGSVDEFTLTLYPFINGSTGMGHGLQERHWVTYGAALREIHGTWVAPDLAQDLTREPFTSTVQSTWPGVSRWTDVVKALDTHIEKGAPMDPIERDLAAFWQGNRAEIQALIDRFETLGQLLRTNSPALVLCHAGIHPNNVLIDMEDQLWIVDWDDALLAPKECDLMFGVGGLGSYLAGPREQAWFLRGYGRSDIDQVALAYYRCLRAIGDIGANGEQVVLISASEATKRNALQRMMKLFEPGYIVSLASVLERVDSLDA
jgi:spectinomycin phosphotransferase